MSQILRKYKLEQGHYEVPASLNCTNPHCGAGQTMPVKPEGIILCPRCGSPCKWEPSHTIPTYYPVYAVVRCDCGHEMELPSFTNECICGELYNSAGQHLAPREQWDYDTWE